jgi:hypothetical protein
LNDKAKMRKAAQQIIESCSDSRWSSQPSVVSLMTLARQWMTEIDQFPEESPENQLLLREHALHDLHATASNLQTALDNGWNLTTLRGQAPFAESIHRLFVYFSDRQRRQISYERVLARHRSEREVLEAKAISDSYALLPALSEAHSKTQKLIDAASNNISSSGDALDIIKRNVEESEEILSKMKELMVFVEDMKEETKISLSDSSERNRAATSEIEKAKFSTEEMLAQSRTSLAESSSALTTQQEILGKATLDISKAQKLLEAVREETTREALAGEFVNQRNSIRVALRWAQGWMMIFWLAVAAYSVFMVIKFGVPTEWPALVFRLVPGVAFAFLGWSFGRRAAVLAQLLEDYRFKAATARTFEGYKREVAEASGELRERLLEKVIAGIGESPTRFSQKPTTSEQHSPIGVVANEALAVAKDASRKIKTMVDALNTDKHQ